MSPDEGPRETDGAPDPDGASDPPSDSPVDGASDGVRREGRDDRAARSDAVETPSDVGAAGSPAGDDTPEKFAAADTPKKSAVADTPETIADGITAERLRERRVLLGVVGFTVVALCLRLVALGGRIFHWDEGRVGYWILRYHETGVHTYRPIVHGPFLPIVNDWLFALIPVSDFAARFPVALVGGLFPLVAWLFRERLRDTELVALAAVLALNPLVVYYSRFMRNDVLVAAFSVVALGFVVRGLDTGRLRYAFPATVSLALAFTTKANALLYVLCFLGAGALLADHRLLGARARGESARAVFAAWGASARERLLGHGSSAQASLARVLGTALGSVALFLVITVFFYAPRPDLWGALANPAQLPGVVDAGTVGAAEKLFDTWGGGGHQDHPYLPYLGDLAETLIYGAPAVLAFGLVGVVVDRYGFTGEGPRETVTFATYWAVASLFGYPIATDIQAPWAAVHVVVPLAVPAAVGVGFVIDSAREALAARDAVSVGLAALVVLAALSGALAANAAYFNSTEEADRQVLQWAQPENSLKPTVEVVGEVSAADDDGADVLFVGSRPPGGDGEVFYVRNESSLSTAPPGGPAWHDRLPLPWYLERYDANVTSSAPDADLSETLADPPPVVIAKDYDRNAVSRQLSGYTAFEHRFRLWDDRVVVFVENEQLERVAPERVSETSSEGEPSS
ncbi:flippase activity-associated protein Agl23 [Halobellus limi]|uniref:TIGR03663 family protein n=1 Tax=Halobellus limi TaxID=699433 RepID=A0A1H6AT32_9EURY|nr:flippase activity-associated protein Agl23 [Halobellus limi]QCC47724.1 TIGR03663 family protein [Halobellus limi]SEG51354.1 TIGR03663 family protein [Halobellus limi]